MPRMGQVSTITMIILNFTTKKISPTTNKIMLLTRVSAQQILGKLLTVKIWHWGVSFTMIYNGQCCCF